jgi:hypothetical protein
MRDEQNQRHAAEVQRERKRRRTEVRPVPPTPFFPGLPSSLYARFRSLCARENDGRSRARFAIVVRRHLRRARCVCVFVTAR